MNEVNQAPLDVQGGACSVTGCENEATGAAQGWQKHPAVGGEDPAAVWVNAPICADHLAECKAAGVVAFFRDSAFKKPLSS